MTTTEPPVRRGRRPRGADDGRRIRCRMRDHDTGHVLAAYYAPCVARRPEPDPMTWWERYGHRLEGPPVRPRATDPPPGAPGTTGGGGKPAQVDGVRVAGKTGTAEHDPKQRAHAWFTGFAPAQDPQIAVAVVVESGGDADSEARGGGAVGGPIAKAMIEAGLKR